MPKYIAYPKEVDTKSRKARKGMRQKTFLTNKAAAKTLQKARKLAREEALAALEIQQEEGTEE